MTTRIPTLDVVTGVLATVLPPISPPVFLRLFPPASSLVDRARTRFLGVATEQLVCCAGGWHDGAGVVVNAPAPDGAALTAEVHEIARALRALADEDVARGYLELMKPRVASGGASFEEGD